MATRQASGTPSSSGGSADDGKAAQQLAALVLQRDHILHDILDHIDEYVAKDASVDTAPLKDEVVRPVLRNDFDPEVQIRGFLRTLRHTRAFRDSLGRIESPVLKEQIEAFLEGRSAGDVLKGKGFALPASKLHGVVGKKEAGKEKKGGKASFVDVLKKLVFKLLDVKTLLKSCFGQEKVVERDLPRVYEDEAKTKVMEVHSNEEFVNWGETVKHTPRYTFVPTTALGVQNLVRYATANNLRVRCGGYRHSWSPIFSQANEILVSFVNLEQVTTLPDPMSLEPGDYTGEGVPDLKTIELGTQLSATKRLCRVGAAVTNEDFRRWAVANNVWALPVDVILVEVTIGGVNGPICHGAGRRHPTVSDHVRRVEYVDCNGALQVVDDPHLLRAAAGAFGLLGVVTHLTFELDAMTYAVMEPRKVDVGLAIPPLRKEDIPPALRAEWFDEKDAEEQMEVARREFERRARDDYYSEWFWFTYQQKAWVNTWNTVAEGADAVEYPDDAAVFLQWIEGWLGGVLTGSVLFNAIPGHWQAQLLATMGMAALPPRFGENDTPTIKTHLTNALHFRRGIQNMRVRDIELQIPIPGQASDASKPDFSVVQRAWWDAINVVYAREYSGAGASHRTAPMRLTLELRIMGASDLLLAPQRGNAPHGTASIEVLTVPDADADAEWAGFAQKVVDRWMALRDASGARLNVRPHWAKEWEGLRLGEERLPARRFLREVAYKDAIPEFVAALAEIGGAQGWGVEEVRERFSNEMWDEVVFGKGK
ncbi:putative FAD-binding type 2 protein [Neofusicoccum parvum]|nr:putative FAD-binding type 2 protein [Neofusicoccum parvum]